MVETNLVNATVTVYLSRSMNEVTESLLDCVYLVSSCIVIWGSYWMQSGSALSIAGMSCSGDLVLWLPVAQVLACWRSVTCQLPQPTTGVRRRIRTSVEVVRRRSNASVSVYGTIEVVGGLSILRRRSVGRQPLMVRLPPAPVCLIWSPCLEPGQPWKKLGVRSKMKASFEISSAFVHHCLACCRISTGKLKSTIVGKIGSVDWNIGGTSWVFTVTCHLQLSCEGF